jgi:hypothetical protein
LNTLDQIISGYSEQEIYSALYESMPDFEWRY